jgi:hypothetical protein
MPLQIRRGTEAERQSLAQTPQSGELIYVTDTEQLYVGDGFTLLRDLSPITGYTDENAVDALGSVFTVSAHSGISFTYNDVANTINAVVSQPSLLQNLNLNNFSITGTGNINIIGNITVDGKLDADFNGSIYGDDSTVLVDGVDNKINLDGTVKGNIIPNVSLVYDIGSSSQRFRDLYLSGTSLYLGAAQVTATGSTINLPVGSTVGGVAIMSGDEAVITDIQGSVFGDDSTVIVDSVDNTLNSRTLTLSQGQINVPGSQLKINSDVDAQTVALIQYAPVPGDVNVINAVVDDSGGPSKRINAGRGTLTAPTALQGSDSINADIGFGHDGSQYILSTGVIHAVDPAGSISSGVMPGTLLLATYAPGDVSGENPQGIRVNRNGNVTINKALDYDTAAALDVEGDVTINGQINLKDLTTTAGSNPGEVDLATSTVADSWLKIKVGGVEYAIPLHALNP